MKKKEKNRYHEITLDEQPFKVEAGLSLQEISEKLEKITKQKIGL